MLSWPLVKYVLTASVRDRLVLSLIIMLLVGTSMSIFMGSAAFSEKERFSVVFAGGGLRFIGILGLVLFAVFHMRRSFETKDVEFLLSRPIGRVPFLLSYAAAFSVLGVVMGLAQGACLYILGPVYFGEGHLLWVLSMIVENIMMVNVALFFSMVLTSAATAAMATFGFYVLGRLMGQILGIIDGGKRGILDTELLEWIMQGISIVVPRLDLLGQTSWLIYGPGGGEVGAGFVIIQGLVFTVLVTLASLVDLVRRQF
jgi:hypothetical protein